MSDSPILPAAGSDIQPSLTIGLPYGVTSSPAPTMTHVSLVVSKTPFPGATTIQGTDGLGGVTTCYVGSRAHLRSVPALPDPQELRANAIFTGDRLSNQHFPWGRE